MPIPVRITDLQVNLNDIDNLEGIEAELKTLLKIPVKQVSGMKKTINPAGTNRRKT